MKLQINPGAISGHINDGIDADPVNSPSR